MILLASVMTGMVGWTYYDASAENVLSRFLILLFALVGGAAMGASVGVITGLILSLANVEAIYQISLLAFAGLLAGLLKEGKKPGVALGLLLGSILLSLYVGDRGQIVASAWESAAAVVLFLLLPKRFIATVAKYVPGTQEHARSQLDYARRMRDVVSGGSNNFPKCSDNCPAVSPLWGRRKSARRKKKKGSGISWMMLRKDVRYLLEKEQMLGRPFLSNVHVDDRDDVGDRSNPEVR